MPSCFPKGSSSSTPTQKPGAKVSASPMNLTMPRNPPDMISHLSPIWKRNMLRFSTWFSWLLNRIKGRWYCTSLQRKKDKLLLFLDFFFMATVSLSMFPCPDTPNRWHTPWLELTQIDMTSTSSGGRWADWGRQIKYIWLKTFKSPKRNKQAFF